VDLEHYRLAPAARRGEEHGSRRSGLPYREAFLLLLLGLHDAGLDPNAREEMMGK